MTKKLRTEPSVAFYLAVLPSYRSQCIELLRAAFGDRLVLLVSRAHLDRTVKTGIPIDQYRSVRMVRFGGRAFLQIGGWLPATRAHTTVIDLNPRSLSAWLILLARKVARRRTLVWGHVYPRGGAGSKTAELRLLMRRIASGTISYTFTDRDKAIADLPCQRVWVATNALYKSAAIIPRASCGPLTDVLYVGRFEAAKKVDLLVEGFLRFSALRPGARLVLIGDGSKRAELREQVRSAGAEGKVLFGGWIEGAERLREMYALAFCSVSPGFAGLGLTQSLGFGVPVLVAQDEPHSPEIELATQCQVRFFKSNSPDSLSEALEDAWRTRSDVPILADSRYVAEHYSAESMSRGLIDAVLDVYTVPSDG